MKKEQFIKTLAHVRYKMSAKEFKNECFAVCSYVCVSCLNKIIIIAHAECARLTFLSFLQCFYQISSYVFLEIFDKKVTKGERDRVINLITFQYNNAIHNTNNCSFVLLIYFIAPSPGSSLIRKNAGRVACIGEIVIILLRIGKTLKDRRAQMSLSSDSSGEISVCAKLSCGTVVVHRGCYPRLGEFWNAQNNLKNEKHRPR